ncbi:MAG: hypothetical protein DWI07_02670 [Planctomycetota bacterium]|nr:MAG: hypothetical protein DWI07_02670 [Planctomycetota bacterium]
MRQLGMRFLLDMGLLRSIARHRRHRLVRRDAPRRDSLTQLGPSGEVCPPSPPDLLAGAVVAGYYLLA